MLPNLIVIGAMKCATTSLHYYLNLHPEIQMSETKELDFFVSEKNWPRGLEWYKSHFTHRGKIQGEASPSYTAVPLFLGVPERMHRVIPDAKLIYMVRDPLERMLSHYRHSYLEGYEKRTLAEVFDKLESNPYVDSSRYAFQLEQYLKYFPKGQILVIAQEDLGRDRVETLKEIFRFLGVEESYFSEKFFRKKHDSASKGKLNSTGRMIRRIMQKKAFRWLSEDFRDRLGFFYAPFSRKPDPPVSFSGALRQKLIRYLQEDVDRLRRYTGRNFKDWCL